MQVGQQSADDARQHSPGKSGKRATGDAGRGVASHADRQQAADAASHAEQAGPAPANGGEHPFGEQAGCHHPGGQRARVQADGGIALPLLIAQEGDDVALDADDEGEESRRRRDPSASCISRRTPLIPYSPERRANAGRWGPCPSSIAELNARQRASYCVQNRGGPPRVISPRESCRFNGVIFT
jgi:hypothetical protein